MNPDPLIQTELLSYLGQLPADEQARVVDFARTLVTSPKSNKVGTPKVGTPGKELLRFAGTISREDAQQMMAAIEDGCEQIDVNDW
jgi:hypothetical protein